VNTLSGKVVFITGGASGIGFAMAQRFAGEGCRIVLADIDAERLDQVARDIAGEVMTARLDTSDRAAWGPVRQDVEDRFGPVDVLCNNAGIASCGNTLAEMPADNFDRMIRINLTGVFNGIHCFVPGMIARRSGHVVMTASLAGIDHPARVGPYSAAKAGVIALADVLRQEIAEFGIGVASICPGAVDTRIDETTRAAGSARPDRGLFPPEAAQMVSAEVIAKGAVDAVRHGHPYFISHGNFRARVESRFDMIRQAFDRAPC